MPKKSKSDHQPNPATPPPPTASTPITTTTATTNASANTPAPTQPQTQTQTAEWHTKNTQAKDLILSNLVPGSEPHTIAKNLDSASDIWKALERKYGPVTASSLASLPSNTFNININSSSNTSADMNTTPSNAANVEPKKDKKRRDTNMDNNNVEEDKNNTGGSNNAITTGKGDTAKRIQELGSLINEKIALFKSVTKENEMLEAELARETEEHVKLKRSTIARSDSLQRRQQHEEGGGGAGGGGGGERGKKYRNEKETIANTQAKVEELELLVNDAEVAVRKEAQARAKKEFFASMPNRDQRFLWALLHGGKPETTAWFNGTNVTP